MLHFVIGGARSGKSRFAENLAKQQETLGKRVIYIATATTVRKDENQHTPQGGIKVCLDHEMLQRIEKHQSDRPAHWQTLETPIELANTLLANDQPEHCILIDCLTLWTLNLLENDCLHLQIDALLSCLPAMQADVFIVSNEVGMGVVPLGQLTRQFVDELGRLHQQVAEACDSMTFMVAGQPIAVKRPK